VFPDGTIEYGGAGSFLPSPLVDVQSRLHVDSDRGISVALQGSGADLLRAHPGAAINMIARFDRAVVWSITFSAPTIHCIPRAVVDGTNGDLLARNYSCAL
jgi:hypothetical protein